MSINQFIDNEVKTNDVVLFMKGTPQFPQCGFSGQLVQIQLDDLGIDYIERRNGLIEKVTLDDVKRVAKRLLDGGILVAVVGRAPDAAAKKEGG